MGDLALPRWLDREAAALHLSLQPSELARLVKRGLLPVPSYHLGPKSPRWDREALDAVFGAKVSSQKPANDPDALAQAAAERIIARAKAKGRPQAVGRRYG